MTTPTILITGASRGIGLGLAESFAGKGYKVFATARAPEKSGGLKILRKEFEGRVTLVPMDVESDESVQKAQKLIEKETSHLDILINNAGRYGAYGMKSLNEIDFDEIREIFEANTLGPLRVTKYFYPLLKKGAEKKLINITSLMGSISDNSSGGSYAYRLSKAALNMLNKNFGVDLKKDGIISVALHPGWVKTDMGGKNAPMELATCVKHLTKTIEGLKPNQTGSFLRYDGAEEPY